MNCGKGLPFGFADVRAITWRLACGYGMINCLLDEASVRFGWWSVIGSGLGFDKFNVKWFLVANWARQAFSGLSVHANKGGKNESELFIPLLAILFSI